MKAIARWGLLVLSLAILVAQPAFAYSYPLSSEAIREAYFLGKGDPNKRADFVGKYTLQLPAPKKGVDVGAIQFETPFVMIADQVSRSISNYFAPDAEQEFLGKPEVCRVRVFIYFNYVNQGVIYGTGPQIDFAVKLSQGGKEILSQAHAMVPIYWGGPDSSAAGTELDLDYDADKIDSSAPADVEVLTPDGQDIHAVFDLESLR
jgi:hypothetical protein